MKDHLKHDEISAVVAGASTRAMDEHIRECGECRTETERFADTLSLFRDSVRDWSSQQEPREVVLRGTNRAPRRWVGWAAVGATACLIAGLTLPRSFNQTTVPRHAVTSMSDAELLSQVDRELSEAVPPSMEPMALNQNRNQQ